MRRPQSGKKRPKQKIDESALVRRLSPADAAACEDFALPIPSAQGRSRLAEWLAAIARKSATAEKLKSLVKDHAAKTAHQPLLRWRSRSGAARFREQGSKLLIRIGSEQT